MVQQEFWHYFSPPSCKTRFRLLHHDAAMEVEFHQLDGGLEDLRGRHPQRQRLLLGSLAEVGQQTPIVVVPVADRPTRSVLECHKRIAALEQLGRDTVEAVSGR